MAIGAQYRGYTYRTVYISLAVLASVPAMQLRLRDRQADKTTAASVSYLSCEVVQLVAACCEVANCEGTAGIYRMLLLVLAFVASPAYLVYRYFPAQGTSHIFPKSGLYQLNQLPEATGQASVTTEIYFCK